MQAARERVVPLYAVVASGGNTQMAEQQLRRELRDHLVFERCVPEMDAC